MDAGCLCGGDEFVVLLTLPDGQKAKQIAGRIRTLYNNLNIGDTIFAGYILPDSVRFADE